MKISIVIPNYNGRELLKANLPKILDYAKGAELIVVDDASTDGSVEMLEKSFSYVRIIRRKVNSGFSSAVNDGVNAAKGELIFLLNHDVVPEKDFLGYIIPHFVADRKVFAVGCLEKSIEGGKVVARGRGIGSFKNGFLIHQRGEIGKKTTLWVSGGAGMFRKDVWLKLGGLDTLYNPFYWEDIDLSFRALKAGYKILFEPQSIVVHKHREGSIRRTFSEEKIRTIAYRNQILFVWLNITDILYVFQHLVFLPLYFVRALVRNDRFLVAGLFEAVKLLPIVRKHRRRNKKLSRFSDKKALEKLAV